MIKGLRERITNLTELAKEQQETLAAVRNRAEEADRLSKAYKEALLDFQEIGKKLDERRNELVKELEDANQQKDVELARLAHLELEEIELKKRSLERVPDLELRLEALVRDLERQLRILTPGASFRELVSHRYFVQPSLFDKSDVSPAWPPILGQNRTGKTYLLAAFLRDWLQDSGTEEDLFRHTPSDKPSGRDEDQETKNIAEDNEKGGRDSEDG
jgi:hypothetical protein